MCQKISKRIATMFIALIFAYSFVCAPDGRAGDNSLRLDGIDIQLGMSKADLEKRLPGKYHLVTLPTELQSHSGLSRAMIFEPDAKTIPGDVYFENNRVVSVGKTVDSSNESDTVRLADSLRAAFMDMLAGKQIGVVAVSVSTYRDSTGTSVDHLSFGLGNRSISINVSHGIEIEGNKFAPEVHVVEGIGTPSFWQKSQTEK
jgi:hypothetical protein